jgi:arylsulfatase A-like enzyme
MVDCLDQAVGRVLATVAGRPDATNTLVLFFSDNGGIPRVGSSNEPWRDGKLSVYEGGTRVCACIRWPAGGLSGGGKFAGRIGYIDVLPTLLAAAGEKPPQNVDGLNLLPVLRHESPLPERAWFSYVHQSQDAHASVHYGSWKLVAHGDVFAEEPKPPSAMELYDLGADPGEKTDCSASHPEMVASLQQKLHEFGKLSTRDAGGFNAGREGFHAPKDWVIER